MAVAKQLESHSTLHRDTDAKKAIKAATRRLRTIRDVARLHKNARPRPGERWLPVPGGYEERYQVSDHGRVRTVLSGGAYKLKNPGPVGKGYQYVQFHMGPGTKPKNHLVHRLVAQAFKKNPKRLPEVHHIDRRLHNNRVVNLKWVSARVNRKGRQFDKNRNAVKVSMKYTNKQRR
ncbi:MAG: NUMOD4 domain-containing protein [Phycisphaerales bacterium]